MDPLKQTIKLAPVLNFTANRFIELAIHSLQTDVYRSCSAIESRRCRINADYRLSIRV
jgi:hypothetical protein